MMICVYNPQDGPNKLEHSLHPTWPLILGHVRSTRETPHSYNVPFLPMQQQPLDHGNQFLPTISTCSRVRTNVVILLCMQIIWTNYPSYMIFDLRQKLDHSNHVYCDANIMCVYKYITITYLHLDQPQLYDPWSTYYTRSRPLTSF